MLGAIPVLLGIESVFREINLGGKAQEMQSQNDNVLKALLTMNSFSDFLKAFIVMSILPGICEELLFRGVLMRMVFVRTQKIGIAIALSSFVFAVVHYNPIGLFAIFFAAVLLGLIYYLTGSLWMSMLAHFLNNGLQIVLMYMGTKNAAIKAFIDGDSIPLYLPLAGLALFAGAFYLLWKYRTPLPDDWADDFKGEERMAENEGAGVGSEGEDDREQLN
jgi:membrane protease YdiL (CAAX protease family)